MAFVCVTLFYLQTAGNTLHGDGATARIGSTILGVDRYGESVAEGYGSEEHFNANLFDKRI